VYGNNFENASETVIHSEISPVTLVQWRLQFVSNAIRVLIAARNHLGEDLISWSWGIEREDENENEDNLD
jgi:hypothetical protein